MISQTLQSVSTLKRSYGFLYQWYDTGTGAVMKNPGDINCSQETTPAQDNCYFLSAVDNGWYASGLVVARQALPELAPLVNSLLKPMDFSIFYDNRAADRLQHQRRDRRQPADRPAVRRLLRRSGPGRLPQRRAVQRPADLDVRRAWACTRCRAMSGGGPGGRLPPQQCATDPDFSWQGQAPGGYWQNITRSAVRTRCSGSGRATTPTRARR